MYLHYNIILLLQETLPAVAAEGYGLLFQYYHKLLTLLVLLICQVKMIS